MMNISQIIILYTLNLYSAVWQVHLNKTGNKQKRKYSYSLHLESH